MYYYYSIQYAQQVQHNTCQASRRPVIQSVWVSVSLHRTVCLLLKPSLGRWSLFESPSLRRWCVPRLLITYVDGSVCLYLWVTLCGSSPVCVTFSSSSPVWVTLRCSSSVHDFMIINSVCVSTVNTLISGTTGLDDEIVRGGNVFWSKRTMTFRSLDPSICNIVC